MAEFISDTLDLSAYLVEKHEGENIRPASFFSDQLTHFFYGGGAHDGALLPWQKTHEVIRLRAGEVSLWHGENYSGKSTLTSHVATDLCAQGYRVCIASMEMMPAKTLAKMCRQALGDNQPSKDGLAQFNTWTDEKLWIYDRRGSVDWEKMLAVIRYAVDKFDIHHFFVDSLMKCVRGETDYDGQKDFVNGLCVVAQDCDVHIHLVHHTKKPTLDEVPNRYQAKGSGSISDQVDNVFGVWRKRNKNSSGDKPDCIVNCDKQRNGEWDGQIHLWFDPAGLQYRGDQHGPHVRQYINPVQAEA